MVYEMIEVSVSGGVAEVAINRPKVLNALNASVIAELSAAFAGFRDDPAVKVVILTGAGEKAFAAGADIGELAGSEGIAAVDLARRGQRLTRRIEHLGKPVIAAVRGFALGGGCELAMACTLRVAGESAVFGQPEVNLGVIPGYGGTQRLSRLVGKGRALDMVLTGRNVKAEEALAMGLVNRMVPDERLMDEARALAGILMKKAPIALRLCMEAVDRGFNLSLDDALEYEAHLFGVCSGTDDARDGLVAFLEKRKPEFKGV
jgi:enoyl-CoA hydratase